MATKKETKTKPVITNETQGSIDSNKLLSEKIELLENNLNLAGKTLDQMQENLKNATDLLNRVANRMGLE